MSANVPLSQPPRERVPDAASESRLLEIRREAETRGVVTGPGVRPPGAPMPRASAETGYYGIHLLKEPQWSKEIPLYFFVGGAAGACATIAAWADWLHGDEELAQHARWIALGGSILSGALLVADLGRPARFLAMMRVFKPQSPMSLGAWTLAAFSSSTAAATFAKLLQDRLDWLPVRILADVAQASSALLGLPFHNYTGVLIGASVIPVWNKNIKTLPIHFGMSGVQAGVSALELLGHEQSDTLNSLGIMSAAFETWEGFHLETRNERELKPLKRGLSGWITRVGGVMSGPLPLALRLFSAVTGSRTTRRWAAWSGIAGSLFTRYGWMQAGRASARDWRIPLEISDEAAKPAQPFPERVPKEFRDRKIA